MPTRFYISNGPASYAPTSPIHRGTWTNGANTYSRALTPRPSGGANVVTVTVGVNANLRSVLNFRTISEPAVKAGTLSGTMQWMAMVLESNAALNAYFMVHAWISVGDSNVVRGTLLNMSQGATEFPTTEEGRTEGAKAITSVNVQVGDRIVIEWGYITTPASSSTTYSARYRVGGTSDTDLTAGSTDSTQSSWVEFSGGEDIFAPAVSTLVSDFTSIPAELAAGAYGVVAPTATGGRLRLTADGTQYTGVMADGYAFDTSGFYIQIPTVLTPSGTITQAYIAASIIDNVGGGGKYIGVLIDQVISKIVFYSWIGYSDASEVQLTYNATQHRWVRVRRSGQQILWDTSPDGTTWTNRRTLTTGPSWMNYQNVALLLEAYKDGTPSSYGEFDNLNMVPPPQNLSRGISDAVTLADAVARVSLRPRALADTAALADTLARLSTRSRAIADTVAAADAVGRSSARPRPAPDTLALDDANTRIFSRIRGIADAVTVADTATQSGQRSRAGGDTLGLAEALSRAATNWGRPTPDTVVLADANTRQLTRPRGGADTATFADALTQQMARLRLGGETVTLVDAVGRVQGRYAAGDDTITLAESVARMAARPRPVPDTVALADTAARAPLARARTIADTVALADILTRAGTRARGLADAVAVGESVARLSTVLRAAGADLGLDDYAGTGAQPFRDLADAATLADDGVAGRGVQRDASDAVVLDEGLQLSGAILWRPGSETVTAVDGQVLTELALAAAVADTVVLADAVANGATLTADGAEMLALADLVTQGLVTARSVTDAVALAELMLAGQAYTSGIADAVTLTDAVARTVVFAAVGAELLGLADAGAAGTVSSRAGDEFVTFTDAGGAGRLTVVGVTDTVHLAELMLAGRLSTAAGADAVVLADAVSRGRQLTRDGSDFVHFVDAAGRDRVMVRAVATLLVLADQGHAGTGRSRSLTDLVKLVDAAYALTVGPNPIIVVRPHSVRQVRIPQSITVVTPPHHIRRTR